MLSRPILDTLDDQEACLQTLTPRSIERLRKLMQHIHTYSEFVTTPRPSTMVAVAKSLQIAVAKIQHHIDVSRAVVTMGSMPEVLGDRTQITMMFQNLIGNTLK